MNLQRYAKLKVDVQNLENQLQERLKCTYKLESAEEESAISHSEDEEPSPKRPRVTKPRRLMFASAEGTSPSVSVRILL